MRKSTVEEKNMYMKKVKTTSDKQGCFKEDKEIIAIVLH